MGGLIGWRFQKRRAILPGVRLNVSRRGGGVSVGRKGARMSVGPRGLIATLTLVGTGLSYIWRRRRKQA
ncbi:MAG TPA: DUF4236 domain-containing protein [Gaiellaceae bacterium]